MCKSLGTLKSSKVSDSFYVSDLNQLVRPVACQQLSLGNVSWCLYKYSYSSNLV